MISRSVLYRLLNSRIYHSNATVQLKKLVQEQRDKRWKEQKWFHICSVNCKQKEAVNKVLPGKKRYSQREGVKVWGNMTISELAEVLQCESSLVLSLIPLNEREDHFGPETVLQSRNLIKNIAEKLGNNCIFVAPPTKVRIKKEKENFVRQPESKPENLVKRSPVVTIMGHVDHGKTTLLDSLRNTFVVKEEFGGITQHIGAFSVEVKPGEKITFIDTPGHAAFAAMRARGANVTDLVVLIIAADDGIMEQTIESIKMAKNAGVRIIVAVNKIDKPTALKIDAIKEKLLDVGIQVEDRGGEVQLVPISALKKINLDLLTEVILLEADLMNLKGDPTGLVEGVVIESKMEPKKGLVATIIVKRGTVTKGKILVAGKAYASVRNMVDENGVEVNEVFPATPIQIFGWKDLPAAGDEVFEVPTKKDALKLAKVKEKESFNKKQAEDQKEIEERAKNHQLQYQAERQFVKSLSWPERTKYFQEKLYKRKETEDTGPAVNLILKGDVYGSLEAVLDILNTYEQDEECRMSIVEASVGNITESDIKSAELFDAIIYAFNTNIHPGLKELVEEKKTDIRFYNVIYKLIDDLKEELSSKLPPKLVEEVIGEANVNQNFLVSKKRKKVSIAGCKCIKGELRKDSMYRVLRQGEVIFEGKLEIMKHLKSEVTTIHKNVECGLMFDSFDGEFLPGDQIICYEMVEAQQETSWDPGF